jgi:HEPN domain-containing protein
MELARAWLEGAESDLLLAELAMREGFFTQVCFMCQQVAEKALKAHLLAVRQNLVRTHVLPRLLHLCESYDARFSELADACVILTAYYTSTRYPEASVTAARYDSATAHQAVGLTREILHLVQERFSQMREVGGGKGKDT